MYRRNVLDEADALAAEASGREPRAHVPPADGSWLLRDHLGARCEDRVETPFDSVDGMVVGEDVGPLPADGVEDAARGTSASGRRHRGVAPADAATSGYVRDMADVTVFVDRAVQGDLPEICVVDGVDTDDTLTLRREVGGGARLGVAWLLALAGPPGWIALLVMASLRSGRAELLTVRLPFCEAASARLQAAKRQMLVGWCLLAAAVIAGLALAVVDTRVGYAAVGSVAVVAAGTAGLLSMARGLSRTADLTVRIELDASRRWVSIRSVHPRFARAADSTGIVHGTP